MKFQRTKGDVPVLGLTECGQSCSLTIGFVGSVEFDRDDAGALAAHLRAAANMVEKMPRGAWGGEAEGHLHSYTVSDGPKMLRETLSVAQNAVNHLPGYSCRAAEHSARLGRLIDECERKRPTGNDGKHDDRHTPECGCLDV